ncbi:MAG: hypothetical protein SFU98_12135 [Leptospiraceae bacterium]|nr:hypothetical protein [Leptospiraceae bacterium]
MQSNLLESCINFGIGFYKTTEETIQHSVQELEKVFTEIKSIGEQDSSERANQIRDLFTKITRDITSKKLTEDSGNTPLYSNQPIIVQEIPKNAKSNRTIANKKKKIA